MTPVQEVAAGLSFTEGPCINRDGTLYVVELANHCVTRVEANRKITRIHLGGSPNGAAFGPTGDLFVTNNGNNFGPNTSTNGRVGTGGAGGYIQQLRADGWSRVVLAEIDGRPLHSPNDLCFDGQGNLYFTDPAWPPRKPDGVPDASRVEPGDICFLGADGRARRCHTGLLFPNGVALTPKRDAIVVTETATGRVQRLAIAAPGELAAPTLYASVGATSGVDGVCFDSLGRLLVAGHGSGRVYVVAAEGGAVEQELPFDDPEVSNVCFGGPDLRTLFVTLAATGRVVALEWDVPGLPLTC